jgi:Fe-Mn family superoxide dismutase
MDAPKPPFTSARQSASPAAVAVRPFLLKPQRMNGLSERLLMSHYENNYGGALRRLNAIRARLAALDWADTPVFEINGLKREELIATGSVILHEIYFDSLGGDGDNPPTGLAQPPAGLAQALERDFGSVMAWRTEFTAMAKALGGGSGWTILAWSERLGRLVNQWATDHAHGLAGATPILALDMYEHAYHLDFGANAAAYVDQVMANLNWERIGAISRGDRRASGGGRSVPPLRRAGSRGGTDFGGGAEERPRRRRRSPAAASRSLSARGSAPTQGHAGGCHDARPCRSATLGRGAAARPSDRGLLHLRVSSQWWGCDRVATAWL